MINITQKENCCGCSACAQRCPKQCITMQADDEGFLYPIIDTNLCIDCGLCEKVCPIINKNEPRMPLKVYAAINKNEEIRMQSSSGGIFTLLAEKTIKEGGVVFGVKFDKNWQAVFDYTETIEGIAPFRGSKYVQATVGNAYKQAESFLKNGRKVLFSGTPCQIAGLKKFLRKEYENLLTVDIICHGVPSPKVWDIYLKETCSKLLKNMPNEEYSVGSAKDRDYKSCIEAISFRSKITGWQNFSFLLKLKFSTNDKKKSVVFSEEVGKNNYMRIMISHLSLRPSCHYCHCKSGKSHSDITIGDFWGIDKYNSQIDDDKGISAVLVNTEKGLSTNIGENATIQEQTFKQITTNVTTYQNSSDIHPKRKHFFKHIEKYDLNKVIERYSKESSYNLKSILKKIIHFIIKDDFRIIWDTPGQTCNRLWSYLDTIGWAIKNNKKVYILFWDKDIIHFDKLRNNPYVKFPFYNKTFVKLFGDYKYYKIIRKIFANRFIHHIYSQSRSNKFVEGWKKRAEHKYFPSVFNEIQKIYTPNNNILNDVYPIMKRYKEDGYFIVGVHIRRGDYKTWEGGKYYFEHEEYAKHMDSIVKLYNDKKICFAISTNEKYNPDVFKNFTICKLNNTTAIHDLYTLSLCDRIIGPLSTFSRWASLYGSVPLCFINKEMQIEKDEDFSIIKDFYHFENDVEIINLTDKQNI